MFFFYVVFLFRVFEVVFNHQVTTRPNPNSETVHRKPSRKARFHIHARKALEKQISKEN